MGAAGFEHPPETSGNSRVSETGGSKSGNIRGGSAPSTPPDAPPPTAPGAETEGAAEGQDADLRAVVEAWPTLAPPIRAAVLAMVRAVGGER